MIRMNPKHSPADEKAKKPNVFEASDEFKKGNPKCHGCPYGNRQHCVGLCWKDTYDSVLKKSRHPRVEIKTDTEVEVVR